MKLIYRLGLIIAGCYFEGAVRNATQLVLYWIGHPDALQGFLPYLIPVFFGYVFALDVRSHWSEKRLKNDIMAYVGSTLLVGHPLFISLSLWSAGAGVDPTTAKIRVVATILLFANLAIAAMVWRGAVRRGFPLSMPWGGVSAGKTGEDEVGAEVEAEAVVNAGAEATTEATAEDLPSAETETPQAVTPQAETPTEETQPEPPGESEKAEVKTEKPEV